MKDLSEHEINTDPIYFLKTVLHNSSVHVIPRKMMQEIFNHMWCRDTLHNPITSLWMKSSFTRKYVRLWKVVNCVWLTGLKWVHQNLVVQQKSARQGVWLLWQWTWLRNVYIRHDCPVEYQPPTFSLHFHSDQRETFSNPIVITDTPSVTHSTMCCSYFTSESKVLLK